MGGTTGCLRRKGAQGFSRGDRVLGVLSNTGCSLPKGRGPLQVIFGVVEDSSGLGSLIGSGARPVAI